MPKNKTPHRISAAEHAENKQSTREIRAEIRAIDSKMKARWLAEKPQALAALAKARAMPKAERDILLHGTRLSGEPFPNAVLRRLRLLALVFCAFALPPPPPLTKAFTPQGKIGVYDLMPVRVADFFHHTLHHAHPQKAQNSKRRTLVLVGPRPRAWRKPPELCPVA